MKSFGGVQSLRYSPWRLRSVGYAGFAPTLMLVICVVLVTLSGSVTQFGVAGVPIVLVLFLIAAVPLILPSLDAASVNGLLWFVSVAWLIWAGITGIRLLVDLPSYGKLAIRDSVVVVCFLGVLVGAGIAKVVERERLEWALGIIVKACFVFDVFYLLSTGLQVDVPVFGGAAFQNCGISAIGLLAYAIWSVDRARTRILYALVAVLTLLVAQSRTLIIALLVLAVLFVFLPSRSGRGNSNLLDRVLILFTSVIGLVLVAFVFSNVLNVSGRIGQGASLQTSFALVQSLFDNSSSLAGSREDRQLWWALDFAKMNVNPVNYLTGIGLGPDLANGFDAGSGIPVRKPHNDYLEALFRTGVFASVALIVIVLVGIRQSFRARFHDPVWAFAFGWLLAASSNALAQPYFSFPHGAIPAAMIIGITVTLEDGVGSRPAALTGQSP